MQHQNIIPYGRHFISDEDINAVVETLKGDFLTQGPKVQEFEDAFAQYVGAKYAVALTNGTAALHLCALALNVDKKSRIITTPLTFAASANCIRYCGGTIDFVDVDSNTILLDLNKVEDTLKKSRKKYHGIIPVDFAGYPVNLEALRTIADKYGLWIIEDACHAPGGYFIDSKGQKQFCGNGNYADLAIFSFHPVKHIATGEGGMITTNRKDLYEKLLLLRTHGITRLPDKLIENHGGWYYEMQELGYNYRLPDMNAALGISQLKSAAQGLERRIAIAQNYDNAFKNTVVKTIKVNPNYSHAYHLYVIQVEHRKALYDFLKTQGIYCQVHYIPVHLMPYYQQLGYKKGTMPVAENYYEQCLSLPMYPTLTEGQQQFVIKTILNFISHGN
jgi:UDP-4-amino-4,6-dideoxy-N-acetyl-beta-L-altrosamine transaminase